MAMIRYTGYSVELHLCIDMEVSLDTLTGYSRERNTRTLLDDAGAGR
jgi:hypothetical protein